MASVLTGDQRDDKSHFRGLRIDGVRLAVSPAVTALIGRGARASESPHVPRRRERRRRRSRQQCHGSERGGLRRRNYGH